MTTETRTEAAGAQGAMRRSMRGVANHDSRPGPPGGSPSTSMRHTAPLRNSIARRMPRSFDGEVTDVRLVADQRDAGPLGDTRRFGNHRGVPAAGRERVEGLHARPAGKPVGEDVGGLPAANERARQHEVDLHAERRQTRHGLAELRRAVRASAAATSSSGHSGPRSAAGAWRTRYSSRSRATLMRIAWRRRAVRTRLRRRRRASRGRRAARRTRRAARGSDLRGASASRTATRDRDRRRRDAPVARVTCDEKICRSCSRPSRS